MITECNVGMTVVKILATAAPLAPLWIPAYAGMTEANNALGVVEGRLVARWIRCCCRVE